MKYPMPLQRVLSGGRITLPTKFREKYGIKDVTVKKKGEKWQ